MDENKKENYRHLGETMIKRFQRRNMDAIYCDAAEDACKTVLDMMPAGSSVTWGGSVTLNETGIREAVRAGDYDVVERTPGLSGDELHAALGRQMMADYFLMSTNAFTRDGELVNIDGMGSRLAFLIAGPKHVIVVAGMNKLATDVHAAFKRIRDVASPANTVRLGLSTPCAKTGVCGDCMGKDTICCQEVITRYSRIPGRITVVMVGEDLGY